jgi:hypothetical protein
VKLLVKHLSGYLIASDWMVRTRGDRLRVRVSRSCTSSRAASGLTIVAAASSAPA